MSFITDTLMHSTNDFTTLFSYGVSLGSFFHFVPFALCSGKRFFLFAKESLILYFLSITGHSKGIETHVNANSRVSVWFLIFFANIARDRHKPFACCCACDCARLRHTLKWPVLDNGRMAGWGRHGDLIEECEVYRLLYEQQQKQKDNIADEFIEGIMSAVEEVEKGKKQLQATEKRR